MHYHIATTNSFGISTTSDGKRVYGPKDVSDRPYDPSQDILVLGDIELHDNIHTFV